MKNTLLLAWRYVTYHKFKTLLMILCIVLTTLLPIALSILLGQFNRQIVSRAESTPLIAGALGSRLDLAMHALYFQTRAPGTITLGQQEVVGDLGTAIPLHVRFTAQKIPVVGTSLDYFEFRGLTLSGGFGLTRLGDCVLGINVASQLKKKTGDVVLTDRENLFDLAGQYPLKLRVAGVLNRTNTPDDNVIFVDVKTTWVIEGLGHGHDDLENETDQGLVSRDGDTIQATAAVLPYVEITENNMDSFHFHGDFNDFPITALIVNPLDAKSEAIVQGRFEREDIGAQVSVPTVVVQELMGLVFRVQKFFNANAIMIALSTLLLLALVIMLSIRLRKNEMQTMFKIGCGRGTMAGLITAELAIVVFCAGVIVTVCATLIAVGGGDFVRSLVAG